MGKADIMEEAMDKTLVSFRCPTYLKYKVMAKFGTQGNGDKVTDAFLAAVHHAVDDVQLTKEALEQILEAEAEAYKKKMRALLMRSSK